MTVQQLVVTPENYTKKNLKNEHIKNLNWLVEIIALKQIYSGSDMLLQCT